eukprot:4083898-Alexandrium_andersonii.AAC.1
MAALCALRRRASTPARCQLGCPLKRRRGCTYGLRALTLWLRWAHCCHKRLVGFAWCINAVMQRGCAINPVVATVVA